MLMASHSLSQYGTPDCANDDIAGIDESPGKQSVLNPTTVTPLLADSPNYYLENSDSPASSIQVSFRPFMYQTCGTDRLGLQSYLLLRYRVHQPRFRLLRRSLIVAVMALAAPTLMGSGALSVLLVSYLRLLLTPVGVNFGHSGSTGLPSTLYII